jgi:hypothetical protein
MQRLVEFVRQYHIRMQLAYYPPYHSKAARQNKLLV